MRLSKWIIALFLILATTISMLLFASASTSDILVDSSSVSAWNSLIASQVKDGNSVEEAQRKYFSFVDSEMSKREIGCVSSLTRLRDICCFFDHSGSGFFGDVLEILKDSFTALWSESDYLVMYDDSLGVYRIKDSASGLWLVNSAGHFPYYRPESTGTDPDPDPEPEEVYRIGQWVNMQKVAQKSEKWHAVSYYELNVFRDQWSDLYPGAQIAETEYLYWLVRSDRYASYVLCDKYG